MGGGGGACRGGYPCLPSQIQIQGGGSRHPPPLRSRSRSMYGREKKSCRLQKSRNYPNIVAVLRLIVRNWKYECTILQNCEVHRRPPSRARFSLPSLAHKINASPFSNRSRKIFFFGTQSPIPRLLPDAHILGVLVPSGRRSYGPCRSGSREKIGIGRKGVRKINPPCGLKFVG